MLEQMKNELANSRVIFITAYDKIEYAAKAIRLSAFDFLMKPVKDVYKRQRQERWISL